MLPQDIWLNNNSYTNMKLWLPQCSRSMCVRQFWFKTSLPLCCRMSDVHAVLSSLLKTGFVYLEVMQSWMWWVCHFSCAVPKHGERDQTTDNALCHINSSYIYLHFNMLRYIILCKKRQGWHSSVQCSGWCITKTHAFTRKRLFISCPM